MHKISTRVAVKICELLVSTNGYVPSLFESPTQTSRPTLSSIISLRASSPECSGGWAGKRKERLQLRLWNLSIICIEAKCWLAEMTLVMTSFPLARVFQCLFTFALNSALLWLAEIWQLSRRGATRELEVELKFQKRSCKLSFFFVPRRQSAPESLLADTLGSAVTPGE